MTPTTAHPQLASDAFAQAYKAGLEGLESSRRFTPEQLEVIYAMGYAEVGQQRWDSALRIFSFLSLYGPTRRHYLVGLATCLQKLGRWDDAIGIWRLVLVVFDGSLEPAFQIAYCQLAAGQREQALAGLQQLNSALAPSDPLKLRVAVLLEQLQSTAQ